MAMILVIRYLGCRTDLSSRIVAGNGLLGARVPASIFPTRSRSTCRIARSAAPTYRLSRSKRTRGPEQHWIGFCGVPQGVFDSAASRFGGT